MSDSWPTVNALVTVQVLEDGTGERASRIEDADGCTLTVAAPERPGALVAGLPEGEVMVRWTGIRGVHELPAQVVEERRGVPRLWVLRPSGEVRVAQRRRFARAQVSVDVSLVARDAAPAPVLTARSVDLSEGGVRCRLTTAPPPPGSRVTAHLTLDGTVVRLAGRVLKGLVVELPGQPGSPAARREHEVVVEFDEDERAADVVRKFVFRQQLLARRTAERSW